MNAQDKRDAMQHLDAHVHAVNAGLHAVLDLLAGAPPGKVVQASSVQALLAPLAAEAEQAEPLVQLLARPPGAVLRVVA